MTTHYETLGIDENASQKEIKKAYRQMAPKFHPDKNNGNSEEFIKLAEAYEILSNPTKKQKYDLKLKEEKEKQVVKKSGLEVRVVNIEPKYSNVTVKINDLKVKYNPITVKESNLTVKKEN